MGMEVVVHNKWVESRAFNAEISIKDVKCISINAPLGVGPNKVCIYRE
jgi:hypothetical protein